MSLPIHKLSGLEDANQSGGWDLPTFTKRSSLFEYFLLFAH